MKKILTLFLLLSVQIPLSAQATLPGRGNWSITSNRYKPSGEHYNSFERSNKGWKSHQLSQTVYFLYNKESGNFYYGNVKAMKMSYGGTRYVRNGNGISKALTENGREYWWGEWKRDYLDGSAMMLKEDGTYVYGEWSFGRLKKDTSTRGYTSWRLRSA